MAFYAKTYYSTNGWTGPQNLSNFGQEISPKITLGYEEFNFLDVINEMKLLYIPCFSHIRNGIFPEIDLFYHDPVLGGPWRYAKLKNVRQLNGNKVSDIRNSLDSKNFPSTVKGLIDKSEAFETQKLKQDAYNVWVENYKQPNIIAAGTEPRFVFNASYEEIKIYKENPVRVNQVMNFASKLYRVRP